ncbi:MAG: c-type cytochrome [Pseudomonadota bacterium]|nr:c-type cytochrome [Pseudomonadota bacterium]
MVNVKQLIVSTVIFLGMVSSGQALASKLADQTGIDEPLGTRSILSPAKIDARTQPTAKVCVEGEDCASGASAAGSTQVAAADTPKSPEELYNNACTACHATGAAGAPKLGDVAAWEPRIAKGDETLYKHAIEGFNMMPAMGTCAACSEDDIKAIVDYMVAESK